MKNLLALAILAILAPAGSGTLRAQAPSASNETAPSQTPGCLLGGWRESFAGGQALMGDFAWTFSLSGDSLTIRRTDGFVSGTLQPNTDRTEWAGSLNWGEGSVWNNVRLSFDSCNLVKTNQRWWFSRGNDAEQARQIAAQSNSPESTGTSQRHAETQQPAPEAQQQAQQPASEMQQPAVAGSEEPAADAPAPNNSSSQSDESALGAFVNALKDATANGDPNAIQNALNQQLANIQAAQARAAAAQAQRAAQQNQGASGNVNGTNPDCPTAAQLAANPKLTCRAR